MLPPKTWPGSTSVNWVDVTFLQGRWDFLPPCSVKSRKRVTVESMPGWSRKPPRQTALLSLYSRQQPRTCCRQPLLPWSPLWTGSSRPLGAWWLVLTLCVADGGAGWGTWPSSLPWSVSSAECSPALSGSFQFSALYSLQGSTSSMTVGIRSPTSFHQIHGLPQDPGALALAREDLQVLSSQTCQGSQT